MEDEVYRTLQDLLQVTSKQVSRVGELETRLQLLQSCLRQLLVRLIDEQTRQELAPQLQLSEYRRLLVLVSQSESEENLNQP